jgi:hypothetical protein
MKLKAQVSYLTLLFLGALAVLLVTAFYYFVIGKYFEVHLIVKENEAERRAINLVEALTNTKHFALPKETKIITNAGLPEIVIHQLSYNRKNLFDIEKMDEVNEQELIKEYSYPNSYEVISISQLQKMMKNGEEIINENRSWDFEGEGILKGDLTLIHRFIDCLAGGSLKKNPFQIFGISLTIKYKPREAEICFRNFLKERSNFSLVVTSVKSLPVTLINSTPTTVNLTVPKEVCEKLQEFYGTYCECIPLNLTLYESYAGRITLNLVDLV